MAAVTANTGDEPAVEAIFEEQRLGMCIDDRVAHAVGIASLIEDLRFGDDLVRATLRAGMRSGRGFVVIRGFRYVAGVVGVRRRRGEAGVDDSAAVGAAFPADLKRRGHGRLAGGTGPIGRAG